MRSGFHHIRLEGGALDGRTAWGLVVYELRACAMRLDTLAAETGRPRIARVAEGLRSMADALEHLG